MLVRRFERLVYTIPRRAGLDDAAAADVFQLTFTRLYRSIGTLQDGTRVRAWLVTTARRETLRELRRAGRLQALTVPLDVERADDAAEDEDDDGPASADDTARAVAAPAHDLSEEERWHEAQRAVARLEPRCRELIELLFLTEPEPSYAEISQRLGLPIGSIGPTRGRCLARLRKALGDA